MDGGGGGSPFDIEKFKKGLFLSYLPCKLSLGVEIWYMGLAKVIDMPFGSFDFSDPLPPFPSPLSPEILVLGRFPCFEFVFCIISVQIKLGS